VSTLVLEPIGGIAGDMTIAALLHLGAPRSALDQGLQRLGLPGVSVKTREVEVAGIRALHVEVRGAEERDVHRPWRDIRDLISRAHLPPRAAQLAQSGFALLAKAEARIHGIAPDDVEFHEVGTIDSIVDVVGAALLVDALAPERILALPPPSGGGTAHGAHGMIPIPAPATLELLRGRTIRPSGAGERTTPTGAAILAAWTEEAAAMPELTIDQIGYGAGTKRWEDAPNLVRALLGRTSAQDRDAAWVLEANLDDLSPQLIAAALDSVLALGALDAWVAPVTMKKGRPAHLFGTLVPDGARAPVEAEMFKQTSTLGIRATRVERRVLERELVEVDTAYGKVRVKIGRLSGAILNVAPEFEDCRQAAERLGVAVKEVMAAALSAFRGAR
jgi:pyridinium-3,5-bisthiocarboxylic acid mononucleotide nickel chelatase